MVKRCAENVETEQNNKALKMDSTPMIVDSEAGVSTIDEDLHSRQIAVYGKESMKRMANASILIIGLKGLGVEVAKNVILAGVKAVALYDPAPVEIQDLGAQFYVSEQDVGKPIALACKSRLQELNKAVNVEVIDEVPESILANFQVQILAGICHSHPRHETTARPKWFLDLLQTAKNTFLQAVVYTRGPSAQAKQFDKICRSLSPPVPFIYSKTAGVFGQVFCDFGPQFVITDVNGEPPAMGIIAGITSNGSATVISCVEEERLQFQEGDLVSFSEVKGMEGINSCPPARVRSKTMYSIQVDLDTSTFTPYQTGGIVTQVKEAKTSSHRSFEECLQDPGEFLLFDFTKVDQLQMQHIAFQVLELFIEQNGRHPAPGSKEDATMLIQMYEKLASSLVCLVIYIIPTTASPLLPHLVQALSERQELYDTNADCCYRIYSLIF